MMEQGQENKKRRIPQRIVTIVLFVASIFTAFMIGLYRMPPTADYDNSTFNEVFNSLYNQHFSQPSESQLWEGAIQGMIDSLDDPFTIYRDAEAFEAYQESQQEGFVGIGVSVLNVEETVVITDVFPESPAEEAGLMIGDIITHVDGVDFTDRTFFETVSQIRGEVGSTVEVGVYRPGLGETITFTMTRKEIDFPSVVGKWLDDDIALIELRSFNQDTADLFKSILEDFEAAGMNGLVIDVRNNGGGFLTTLVDILDEFLEKDDMPLFSREVWNNRTMFRDVEYGDGSGMKPYPISIVVNQFSASASEVFAAAMHEKGGYDIFGVTTYGKGTHQTGRRLESRSDHFLTITTGIWLTSEGHWIDRASDTPGFEPNHYVTESDAFTMPLIYLRSDETYQFDMVHDKIELAQKILNLLGYDIREDGYFDILTENAMKTFQTEQGLTDSGELNNETANALSNFLLEYRDDINNDVQLQAALNFIKDQLND